MAYPPGMELHGKRWRVVKRIPTDMLPHYAPEKYFRPSSEEPDKRKAGAILWRMLAEREEEYQRIRDTGSRFKQAVTPEELSLLVRLMVRSSLEAHEASRDAGDFADDVDFARAENHLDISEEENKLALSRRIIQGDLPGIAQDWLIGHGYSIPSDSDTFGGICLAFAKGRAEAIKAKRSRNLGEWVETPPEPVLEAPVAPSGTPMLSEVVRRFLAKQDQGASMFKKFQVATDLLLEVLGDRPISSLRQLEIDDFFALLCKLPPRWRDKKRQQRKTVAELAAMNWPECINKKTFDDSYMAALRPFFRDAARAFGDAGWPRHLTTEGIKYSGDREGGERKQRAMRPDELKRLFEGPEFAAFAGDPERAHCYWLPLVGLYTGARVNEVCQLNPQCDIREEEGVWFFDITEDSETDARIKKSVKNKPSRRRTPIHSALIALGFLDYAQKMKDQGHALLFPQFAPTRGKASGTAEKWFRGFLEELGLRDETPGRCLLGFHCWRSTFLTRADHLDILNPGTLTGHSQGATGGGKGNRDEDGYKDPVELGKNQGKMESMFYEVVIPRRV